VKGGESRNTLREKGLSPQSLVREDGFIHGGVGGASEMKKSMGTTAVDMMANTRILEVAYHVDISTEVSRLNEHVPTCGYLRTWVTAADPTHLQSDSLIKHHRVSSWD
jgi:hypothetical protein